MPCKIKTSISLLVIVVTLLTCGTTQGCDRTSLKEKGDTISMKTYCLGRFSIAVPVEMKEILRSSQLRSVKITEVMWEKDLSPELARSAEWEHFMAEVKQLIPPKGKDQVIIRTHHFPAIGRWIKGMFFRDNKDHPDEGTWTLLMDAGPVGVWLTSNPVIVEKEITVPKTEPNFENIAKAYQLVDMKSLKRQPDNRFYLQYGAINLPYFVREATIARFEGTPFDLKLLIEMEMDFNHEIETMGLITKTRGMLAAALVTPGGSISKVRLGKRNVAGMPGEEAVLKVREGNDTDFVFTWEYNGKDDSGEYPTTRINMESADGNLDEKLRIWDAMLDSMRPMFVRKN